MIFQHIINIVFDFFPSLLITINSNCILVKGFHLMIIDTIQRDLDIRFNNSSYICNTSSPFKQVLYLIMSFRTEYCMNFQYSCTFVRLQQRERREFFSVPYILYTHIQWLSIINEFIMN